MRLETIEGCGVRGVSFVFYVSWLVLVQGSKHQEAKAECLGAPDAFGKGACEEEDWIGDFDDARELDCGVNAATRCAARRVLLETLHVATNLQRRVLTESEAACFPLALQPSS